MKISRDGKTYDLTASELAMAWEEHQRKIWRYGIEDAIERNAENIRWTDYTMEEFIEECLEQFTIDDDLYSYAEEKNYEDVVVNAAELNDMWIDDPDEEEDEDD